MEITGIVKVKTERETFGAFIKRHIIVVTDDKFPQHFKIEFHKDSCDFVDKVNVGDTVKCAVNVNGKEYLNPKNNVLQYFLTLVCWKVDVIEGYGDASKLDAPGESTEEEEVLPF
jgi:hypothetical protein